MPYKLIPLKAGRNTQAVETELNRLERRGYVWQTEFQGYSTAYESMPPTIVMHRPRSKRRTYTLPTNNRQGGRRPKSPPIDPDNPGLTPERVAKFTNNLSRLMADGADLPERLLSSIHKTDEE
jgi:hypothetical protein